MNERHMSDSTGDNDRTSAPKGAPAPMPEAAAPIKLPNPPDEKQPETPKIGSRDAPGG